MEVLTDRLKVYTIHAGCQSYLFNLIRSFLCITLTFLLLQFFCVCECALYHNTLLVHLSLGNKVVLYGIVLCCIVLYCTLLSLQDRTGCLLRAVPCCLFMVALHLIFNTVVYFLGSSPLSFQNNTGVSLQGSAMLSVCGSTVLHLQGSTVVYFWGSTPN